MPVSNSKMWISTPNQTTVDKVQLMACPLNVGHSTCLGLEIFSQRCFLRWLYHNSWPPPCHAHQTIVCSLHSRLCICHSHSQGCTNELQIINYKIAKLQITKIYKHTNDKITNCTLRTTHLPTIPPGNYKFRKYSYMIVLPTCSTSL